MRVCVHNDHTQKSFEIVKFIGSRWQRLPLNPMCDGCGEMAVYTRFASCADVYEPGTIEDMHVVFCKKCHDQFEAMDSLMKDGLAFDVHAILPEEHGKDNRWANKAGEHLLKSFKIV